MARSDDEPERRRNPDRREPVADLTANGEAAAAADQQGSEADLTSFTADVVASDRDEAAVDREAVSRARDHAADARDLAAEEHELAQGPGGPEYEAAVRHASEVRAQAATDRDLAATDREQAGVDREEATLDRERAAGDRKQAAIDRVHAAMDRRQALAELERAHTDDLTGAYRRGAGQAVLQQEVDRSKRTGEGLVLAYVDVDGLKATNDSEGHAAGDARLRDVVDAIRAKVRSYEPIVRYGGDEFICSFSGADPASVSARFDEINAFLLSYERPGSISVGLAQLEPDENLDDLIARADLALIASRADDGRHR